MTILYVTTPDVKLKFKDINLQISFGTNNQLERIDKIKGIVLIGSINLEAELSRKLLEHKIPITWLSDKGYFIGRLEPTHEIDIKNHIAQYKLENTQTSLEFAKTILHEKIQNCQKLLENYGSASCQEIKKFYNFLKDIVSIEQLRQLDSNFSDFYYAELSKILPSEFHFHGRSKQPPLNPFNSMLSFGYTLLIYEVYTMLIHLSLQPYFGYFNENRKGFPALAVDLMEKWRPEIIDYIALDLVLSKQININEFTQPNTNTGRIDLLPHTCEKFIDKYQKILKKNTTLKTQNALKLNLRNAIELNCQDFLKLLNI